MAGPMSRLLASVAPQYALRREIARAQLDLLQRRRAEFGASAYAPVGGGRRSREFYRNSRDAHGAMQGAREPLAYIARDMLRNNPRVTRANELISGYTVGSGIRPVVEVRAGVGDSVKDKIEGLINDHLLTTAVDADGTSTLFGLQRLGLTTTALSGEVLMRRRFRRVSDGLPLPFQVQCLETDYIAATKHTLGSPRGRRIENGIEYGPTGKAEAFHIYAEHPGSIYGSGDIRRVAAENIAHVFKVDRPGQRRGVSWYAPVMAELHDLHKFMQGTLKRQEVAAMFAGILTKTDGNDPTGEIEEALKEIEAGGILELNTGEELNFTDPPDAQNAAPVVNLIDRVIASGLMLTYEGFSGDYSQVNYTSGRMGRMDQDPVIQFWQNELVIARMMGQLTSWFKDAVYLQTFIEPGDYRLNWTAPRRPVVDPTKDFPALVKKIRGGLDSRQSVIRSMGQDPARINREIMEDAKWADDNEMVHDSDARRVSNAGVTQARSPGTDFADHSFTDEDDSDD